MVQGEENKPVGEHKVKTILLVDDDASIGEVLVHAITQETSYLAILVSDGFEALNAARQIKPNLLVLDYQLPHINGLELYDRLHEMAELQHVSAVMISANLPQSEIGKRNIRGLHKPLDLDEFLQVINELLH